MVEVPWRGSSSLNFFCLQAKIKELQEEIHACNREISSVSNEKATADNFIRDKQRESNGNGVALYFLCCSYIKLINLGLSGYLSEKHCNILLGKVYVKKVSF